MYDLVIAGIGISLTKYIVVSELASVFYNTYDYTGIVAFKIVLQYSSEKIFLSEWYLKNNQNVSIILNIIFQKLLITNK